MVSGEGYEEEWNEDDEWNDSWNEGYGPMIKTGTKAIGPMKICTTRMSIDICRRKDKEKERKARKARMMRAKEENQEMEKENQSILNLRLHQLLLCRTKNTKLITFSSVKLRARFRFIF